MDSAQKILTNTFGYSEFRHNQADIIRAIIQGQDAFTLMPTGGGKSLCYQIPALVRDGVGVVVSPLIALMQDQVDALRQLGIRAAFLNSTLNRLSQQKIEQSLLEGGLDLVYIAPERLMTERMLSLLDKIQVALFAIDEAHCVSQWGHDFRKEYQQLSILHERYSDVPRVALTATADQRTRSEIITQLNLQQAEIFVNSFDRPNIHYAVSDGQNAREQLWRFIQREHPQDAGIVYCLSRKKTEAIAQWLAAKGRLALPYHAGLPAEMRQQHQERFLREDGVIIVATIAFGMGIDKPDVRFVAHLNLPKSIEAYYQETGRAGRDGTPANAWMAYGLQDVIMLRQMVQDGDADEQYKRITHQKLEAMLGLCELISCRRQSLLGYFGETLEEPCGNCDNCTRPPQTWDGSVPAQKALSTVYRTGQRFGVTYIINVLTGKKDERICRNRHDQISTFGIGNDYTGVEWRSIFRQLIAQGYLSVDEEGYGGLTLTEKCRPVLRGEQSLELRKLTKPEKVRQEKKVRKQQDLRSIDEPLFAALRTLRLSLAQEQGVPPYVIFHDSTLTEMARTRPTNPETMRYISGVGEKKLQHYGQQFLAEIAKYPLPELLDNNLSDTVNETLALHQQGNNAEAIALARGLKLSTIHSHLAEAVADGRLHAREVLPLDDAQYAEIVNALEMLDAAKDGSLKPVFEALDEKYDYGVLKCVLAQLVILD
ncbi:ATP-dependent DNA helicase RecQ [hydrothermal vent metagenome]|uniref:DNA 3'-5' helicase n=1 Tax=hydrothermal vent metagenome TaxID=652676 RepID=A0A3B1AYU5_9ZZZZ